MNRICSSKVHGWKLVPHIMVPKSSGIFKRWVLMRSNWVIQTHPHGSCERGLATMRTGCYKTDWLVGLLSHTQSAHIHFFYTSLSWIDVAEHKALPRSQENVGFMHLDLQNCEVNEPHFFLNYQVSSILLWQQEMDFPTMPLSMICFSFTFPIFLSLG